MAELVRLAQEAGMADVRSYLQSGNLIFDASDASVGKVLEEKLSSSLGLAVPVIVRSLSQLRLTASQNPFALPGADEAKLHVTFFAGPPSAEALRTLDGLVVPTEDRFTVRGTEAYLSCPGGYGATKLSNAFFERMLAVKATTRNWRTVTTLLAMAEEERA
jgi:uncharacterized protein (DUF1697 family)